MISLSGKKIVFEWTCTFLKSVITAHCCCVYELAHSKQVCQTCANVDDDSCLRWPSMPGKLLSETTSSKWSKVSLNSTLLLKQTQLKRRRNSKLAEEERPHDVAAVWSAEHREELEESVVRVQWVRRLFSWSEFFNVFLHKVTLLDMRSQSNGISDTKSATLKGAFVYTSVLVWHYDCSFN